MISSRRNIERRKGKRGYSKEGNSMAERNFEKSNSVKCKSVGTMHLMFFFKRNMFLKKQSLTLQHKLQQHYLSPSCGLYVWPIVKTCNTRFWSVPFLT